MTAIDAEGAYLFRHALLRDAALQLHMPDERAGLHALALELSETLLQELPADYRAAWAADLADHARHAAHGLAGTDLELLQRKEALWLREAAAAAKARHGQAEAARCLERAIEVGRLQQAELESAYHELATLLLGTSRYEAAGQVLDKALQNASHAARDQLRLLRAKAHFNLMQFDQAVALLELLIHDASRRGDARAVSQALGALGVSYSMRGRHADAVRHYDAAVQAAEQLGDSALIASALANRSDSLYRMGRFAEAREQLERALPTLREGTDSMQALSAIARHAIILDDLGLKSEAERASGEAEHLARRCGNLRMIAILLGNRGNSEYEALRPHAALRLYAEAEAINREIGHQLGVLANITNRGGACRMLGDLEGALRCANEGIAMARRLGQRELLATNLSKRAMVLLDRDEHESALAAVREAEEIMDAAGLSMGFERLGVTAVHGDALFRLGDADGAGRCAARFREVVKSMQVGPDHHNPAVREAFERVQRIGL
ncbi:MAG: tetratricopeptide repeat protein [Planctomycetes bacterium]|nr:tetratricopeptide repeat protein [Planctomycetota bacterium]MCW8134068.1 tetratricopeptide repeat protein [Planctomycetota bacterium]